MGEPAATRLIVDGERLAIREQGHCFWDGTTWVVTGWWFWGETDPRDLAWHEIEHADGSWEPYSLGGWGLDELRDFSRAGPG